MSHSLTIRSWPRAIVHIDGDAFFASCEQALHPEYRGKPVITGKERGAVIAASYEAQAKGVTRGVPLWDVKKICPDAIIVPSDYESYQLFSKRMFAIMRRFTPVIEEYSIDEAFTDITGFRRCYHASYPTIATRMKEAIEKDLGITVSVGVSISKVLAKVASKWQKPSGFTIIPGYDIQRYLEEIMVSKVWGIGPRTAAYCRAHGIFTALDFALKSEEYIRQRFSKPYVEIWHELNGRSVLPLNTEKKTTYASISKTRTFTPPSANKNYLYSQILTNLENACIKARKNHLVATGLHVFLKRQQDFRIIGLEATFTRATAFPQDMTTILQKLLNTMYQLNCLYRATGVTLIGLRSEESVQMSLFESPIKLEKMRRIYKTIDQLAEKLGKHAVHLGSDLMSRKLGQ